MLFTVCTRNACAADSHTQSLITAGSRQRFCRRFCHSDRSRSECDGVVEEPAVLPDIRRSAGMYSQMSSCTYTNVLHVSSRGKYRASVGPRRPPECHLRSRKRPYVDELGYDAP